MAEGLMPEGAQIMNGLKPQDFNGSTSVDIMTPIDHAAQPIITAYHGGVDNGTIHTGMNTGDIKVSTGIYTDAFPLTGELRLGYAADPKEEKEDATHTDGDADAGEGKLDWEGNNRKTKDEEEE